MREDENAATKKPSLSRALHVLFPAGEFERGMEEIEAWATNIAHPWADALVQDAKLVMACVPHLEDVYRAEKAHDLRDAEKGYRRALAIDPDWTMVWVYLGINLAFQERFAERDAEVSPQMKRRNERPADEVRQRVLEALLDRRWRERKSA